VTDLELARHLAAMADEMALHWFERGFRTTWKRDGSPVTEADLAVDAAICEEIALHRPDDALLTEEGGASGDSNRRWLVDPIDGTSWFVDGLPHWGTHIALEEDGEVVVGIITRPVLGITWWAAKGEGAHRSDRAEPLRVSTTPYLAGSTVTGYVYPGDPVMRLVQRVAHWKSFSSPSLAILDGAVDAVVSTGGYEWDHAPLVVLLAEAGGRFSDPYGGKRFDLQAGIYTNGHVHDELAALIYG
jgi:histidinol-phosphatase